MNKIIFQFHVMSDSELEMLGCEFAVYKFGKVITVNLCPSSPL